MSKHRQCWLCTSYKQVFYNQRIAYSYFVRKRKVKGKLHIKLCQRCLNLYFNNRREFDRRVHQRFLETQNLVEQTS